MTKAVSIIRVRASVRACRLTAALCVCGQIGGTLPALASERTAQSVTAPTQSPAPPVVKVNRTVPRVTPPPAFPVFSEAPTDAEITRARVFPEPLLPIGAPAAPLENLALSRAITTYLHTGTSEDVAPFLNFLAQYRESPWRASLLANLGGVYRRTGYLSRALAAWDEAWHLAKDRAEPSARTIGYSAVAEWLELSMSVGRTDAMTARLAELDTRALSGTAATRIQLAREGLSMITGAHHMGVGSGPLALEAILGLTRGPGHVPSEIANYMPMPRGTSLVELAGMAKRADMHLQMAVRTGDRSVPVGSVVHLKSGHFSAIVRADEGRYLLQDAILGGSLWISRNALNDEGSGFFLIPGGALPEGWRAATTSEAEAIIGHCAPGPPDPTDPNCPTIGGGGPPPGPGGASGPGSPPGGCASCGMPTYGFMPNQVALRLTDTPVGYAPPRGPGVFFQITYNQLVVGQPQTFSFWNLGPKWTSDWLSYITDDPTSLGSVSVYLRGSGLERYGVGNDGEVSAYHWRSRARLVRTSSSPIRYERRLRDGSVDVFATSDNATGAGRRVFLTDVIDPRGQTLHYTYDSQLRLLSATDALGQVTTLAYELAADPLRVTRVTDPFGRSSVFTYNDAGQLASVTDVIGLTSSFTYGPFDFIAAMTTPYGTTTFEQSIGPINNNYLRFIQATDPLGGTERAEFRYLPTPAIPPAAAPGEVPTGFDAYNGDSNPNHALNVFNTFYWDKRAMASGGATSAATVTHWLLGDSSNSNGHIYSAAVPHSIKRPLENRVWFAYRGQNPTGGGFSIGDWVQPTQVAHVLDDGTSQIWASTYNDQGMVTSSTDPQGRRTTNVYATNGIDVLETRQTTGTMNDLLASFANYNAQHLPASSTDAAGKTTTYTYYADGQVNTITNPKQEPTTSTYDADGKLQTVTGHVAGATTTYTYDALGHVRTVTDSDGYTLTFDYDALDRPTRVTYPDGTYVQTIYDRLDVAQRRDRLGRVTRYFYDPQRRLIATRDPQGRTVTQQWCTCGSLDKLIDANGHATTWERDLRGRVTREVRADGTTVTQYVYESTTNRLKTATDRKGQVTTYSYNRDDTLQQAAYTNVSIATPSVSFTYDPAYNRVATMVDGTGTTSYAYKLVGALGALQEASVDGPLTNDTITYQYDELGRPVSRAINGMAATQSYDALGRVSGETNVLGPFTYGYEGFTDRLSSVTYPNQQTSSYGYFDNLGDHRLQTIHHRKPDGSTLSKFDYTYDAAANILTWRQQADTTAVVWTYGYDGANQLTNAVKKATDPQATVLKRYAYVYDPAGNRTSEQIDDVVTAAGYDSLNRLISQHAGGALVFKGSVDEPATVTIQGRPATVTGDNRFQGSATVAPGTTAVTVKATDPSGNVATAVYEVDQSGVTKTLTYDANGNLTADGTRIFEWDARNQLLAITVGTHRSEFTYDGLQRRVREVEKENGVVQSFSNVIWCQTALCEERAADGVTVTRRSFSRGEQVAGVTRFFAGDHLGSVADVTDNASVLLGQYAFDPWGRRTVTTGTNITNVGYTGHRWQDASGLSLTLYRGYDPELGRWVSEDPAGRADGLNLNAYAGGNPVRFTDLLGLCSCDDECPSGSWDVDVTLSYAFGAVIGTEGGEGVIRCSGKPNITRRAKVGCVYRGVFLAIGIGTSVSIKPPIKGPCNRSQLRITKTEGWIAFTGPVNVSGSDGSVTGVGVGLPPNGGFAWASCIIAPR